MENVLSGRLGYVSFWQAFMRRFPAQDVSTVWRRPSMIENPWIRHGFTFLAIAYLFWSVGSLEIDRERVSKGLPRAANIFERMLPPNRSHIDAIWDPLLETIHIATLGTLVTFL